ncbi:hypothetical protein [Cellulomonas cellasea]|uniref:hypothetical protein n=1 Tax=Cellulomonas cellasea TaxID=43670 RepID=UPI000B0DF5F5|nr:hypothetical protein [Cellulomonas cellasea]
MSTPVPQHGTNPTPHPTPHPVPQPPAGSRSAAPAAPRSTRGAKVLTFSGAFVLLLTLALSIGVARVFLGLLPLGVVTSAGEPGPAVVASLDAPGAAEVELAADRYAVYVAQPSSGGDADDAVGLATDLLVSASDGTVVDTSRGTQVTMTTGGGGVTAHTVASFTITEPGTYTVIAPATEDGSPATVLLAPDQDFAPFFAGIFGSILGVFLAIGLGLLGVLMLAGGIVWWVLARRTRLPSADLPQADGRLPGAPAV